MRKLAGEAWVRVHIAVMASLVAAVLAGVIPAAATVIPGGNIINQTWTPAGNPYIVQGDITVPSGAYLTIQAGTVVQFASGDSQGSGIDTGRIELTVKGGLAVEGTTVEPVIFQAQSGASAGLWYGIVVDAAATAATISGAHIQHALYGIYSSGPVGVLVVRDSILKTNAYGVLSRAGTPVLDRLTLESNSTAGAWFENAGGGTLSNSIVRANGPYGVLFNPYSAGIALSVVNCTIHGNSGAGIYYTGVSGASATFSIRNTIVTENGTYGITRMSVPGTSLAMSITYSNVWGNTSGNYSSVGAGANCISANPLYVNAPPELRLRSTSPCIDTGTASGAPNQDWDGYARPVDGDGINGVAYDMGAYEYASLADVNDAPLNVTITGTVASEGLPPGTSIGIFASTDPDNADTFSYSLVPGTGSADNDSFVVVGNELRTAVVLDYEARIMMYVRVRTTDQGGLWYERAFTIGVLNVSEPPVAVNDMANALEDTPIDLDVLANDNDPQGARLYFVDPPGIVCPTTPEVRCQLPYVPPSDFCGMDVVTYTISNGQYEDTAQVEVAVICVPDMPTDIILSSSTVPEGQSTGAVIGDLSTVDPDVGDTFTYELVAGDVAAFAIEAGGDRLLSATTFDYEVKSSWQITVRSTDQVGRAAEKVFTVNITDVNESPTELVLNRLGVVENLPGGTHVGDLSVIDPDPGVTPAYSLVPGEGDADNGWFTIIGSALRTAAILDHESQATRSVRVRYTDGGGLSVERAFEISITDMNDPPVVSAVADRTLSAGIPLSLTLDVSDQDGDIVLCAMSEGPLGCTFDENTCTFSWTPGQDQIGDWRASFIFVDTGNPPSLVNATANIAVTPPLLYEAFTDGTSAGDPDWLERRGNWTVDARKRYVSTSTMRNLALVRGSATAMFETGRISARIALGQARTSNATIVFGYQKVGTTYSWRSVTIAKNRITVGEQGRTLSTKVTALSTNHWYTVSLDLRADGRVNVNIDGVRRHTFKFAAPAAGRIGLAADMARSFFDDVTAWTPAMLAP